MTPKRRAILIVALVLVLVAIVIFAIFLLRSVVPEVAPPPPVEETVTEDYVPPPPEPVFVNPLIPKAQSNPGRTAAQQMAELFAERYGSYSNQGDYRNLTDLLPVMTARYRQSTEAFLASADAAHGQAYEGVTSKKVSSQVRKSSADSAVVAVTLQQTKTSGGGDATIGYRTLRLELLRAGDDWRVDVATWED